MPYSRHHSAQVASPRVRQLTGTSNSGVQPNSSKNANYLGNVATLERATGAGVVTHLNIQPVYDIFANVQSRDLGSVAQDIQKIIDEYKPRLKPGNAITIRGLVESMDTAFLKLGIGFIGAIVLVYLLMVVNFQSWTDPLIIITALPGALAGIIWMLFLTTTTFNVPSLMGSIMSIGVATANSILMITFANEKLHEGMNAHDAALEAGPHPSAPGDHDGLCHDCRHDTYVSGPGRRRRAKRASGQSRHRRAFLRYAVYSVFRACGLCHNPRPWTEKDTES